MADSTATLLGGTALLERAVGYTLGSLLLVRDDLLSRPTPCRGWNLRRLLGHMNDSLAALQEAADLGEVMPEGLADRVNPRVDPVTALRDRACWMVGAWSAETSADRVSVGGFAVPSGYVTGAGAIEITVHGWDVASACRQPRPIPARLAESLLDLCYVLVLPQDRPSRFASRVDVSPWSSSGDRLLAYLGRQP